MLTPTRPNDPQAQARAAELHPPDAATGGQITGRERIASRMSPAAQWLGGSVLQGQIGELAVRGLELGIHQGGGSREPQVDTVPMLDAVDVDA